MQNTYRGSLPKRLSIPRLICPVLTFLLVTLAGCASGPEVDGIPARRVVFSIGQRDRSYDEFTARESLDAPQYECTVGVDCSTETFPVIMTWSVMTWSEAYARGYPEFAGGVVESIKIYFTLARDHADLTLRVSRGGDETLLIALDERDPIPVTAAMQGSDEPWQPSTFDVLLGPVTKGSHTLLFTVHPTDGDGLPWFNWDALLLFTGLP